MLTPMHFKYMHKLKYFTEFWMLLHFYPFFNNANM